MLDSEDVLGKEYTRRGTPVASLVATTAKKSLTARRQPMCDRVTKDHLFLAREMIVCLGPTELRVQRP